MWVVGPMVFTPIGAVAGLVLGLLVKSRRYLPVLVGSLVAFAVALLVLVVFPIYG